jgi:two-component system NtrC family sensor kinase
MTADLNDVPVVLVVDDLDANLVAVEALLEGLPCRVMRATSGAQALALLLRHEFAVMLLDVQMPVMDGYEVARHARGSSLAGNVPIIFVTAVHDSEEHKLRGYGSGAVDFLFKPIVRDVLRSKVSVFLELYAGRRELAKANTLLERKNAELEHAYRDLQSTQAQLVQAAKLASVGELVAGVSHEINNPLAFSISHLSTIRSSLERFRESAGSDVSASAEADWSRARSRLTEAMLGLDRIRELVLKLRTLSRLEDGEWRPVSIPDCVESVLAILGHRLEERIRIEVALAAAEKVEGYPALMSQLLLNLVANSIEAIEGPGVISIRSSSHGGRSVISVTDNGSGIPPELRERVFEPFFTTKSGGVGSGLGLAIARSIVEKHRGSLELREAPGGGTVATVKIPSRASMHGELSFK